MKSSIASLAVCGGEPAFKDKLFVGRPNIGDRERLLERIGKILDTKWLSNDGPFVVEFEKRIADLVGVEHCVAMCNATIALEIAIRALGMTNEVIVPSFTFIATAHALQWQEITPVFCDIDPATHTLNPDRIAELITPRTTGIIGVHTWGRACDVNAINEIARSRGLKVLYDAAHSFGCSYRGEMIGRFGDAEVFSFHATKFFNSFEGGAVTTNDATLAAKIRLMKNFGFTNWDEVSYVGTNGKMTEIAAAMGLTSLEDIDEFINVNRANYESYKRHLADVPGVRLLTFDDDNEQHNYQYIVLEIDKAVTQIGRDELLQVLWAENIIARRYFYPGCHRMEPYRSFFPHSHLLLPETERVAQRVLVLPTGTSVNVDEIEQLCQIIKLVISNGKEVSALLQSDGLGSFSARRLEATARRS
jgi:dTDP-4-amino-4,6-dideoxygalactose transaminase